MRAIIVLCSVLMVWILIPSLSDAGERDRYEKYDGKNRGQHEYRVDRDHDRRYDSRDKGRWDKRHSHDARRPHRQAALYQPVKRVVYNPFMGQIVVREPVVYYPVSYLTIGGPNLSFHVAW